MIKDKVVIITGASSGIGEATTKLPIAAKSPSTDAGALFGYNLGVRPRT